MNRVINKGILTVAAIVSMGFATTASAIGVTIDSEDRYVRSNGDVNSEIRTEVWSITEKSPSDTGVFNAALDETRYAGTNSSSGGATIDSSISLDHFSAAGTASGAVRNNETSSSYYYSDGDGYSNFRVGFTLAEKTWFNLKLLLNYVADAGSPRGGVRFTLTSDQGFNLSLGDTSVYDDYNQSLALRGVLDAARYTLQVYGSVQTDGYYRNLSTEAARASYNMDMKLAPVPVPAAVWMFGSGLGLLGWFRKRNAAKVAAV